MPSAAARCLIVMLAFWSCASGATPLRFATSGIPGDNRYAFARELLALAAIEAGHSGGVVTVPGMDEAAMITALGEHRIDVAMLPLSASLPPTRRVAFPIRGGLLGLRVVLAKRAGLSPLMRAATLAELQQRCRFAYQRAWLDAPLLERAGFRLHYENDYAGVFRSVRDGQSDCVSRGASEVGAELADPNLTRGLEVVPGLALFYPLDDGYFVAPGDEALALELVAALRRLRANGRYADLFQRHFGATLAQLQLRERRVMIVSGYPAPHGMGLRDFTIIELAMGGRPPAGAAAMDSQELSRWASR